jgi:VanZ family protein
MMFFVRPDLRSGSRWLWTGVAVVAAVLLVSLLPLDTKSLEVTYIDKFLHLIAFMLLMIFLGGIIVKQFHWLLFLFLYAFGALIEALQILVPGRAAEVADLLADFAGLTLGWLLIAYVLADWCLWLERRRAVS